MTKYGIRDSNLKVKKATINKVIINDKIPVQYIIPKTVAEGTSSILTGHDFNATGTAAVDNTGLLIQPAYPIQLHVNWNAAGTADDSDALTFAGEDAKGADISEAVIISSAATGDVYTSNAFAKIDTITPNQTIKNTDLGIGVRKIVGLPYPIAANTDIISYAYDGAYATTAVDALTVDATYDVVTLPTMAADKVVSIVYLSKVQE